jgi:hypothetical protein
LAASKMATDLTTVFDARAEIIGCSRTGIGGFF